MNARRKARMLSAARWNGLSIIDRKKRAAAKRADTIRARKAKVEWPTECAERAFGPLWKEMMEKYDDQESN